MLCTKRGNQPCIASELLVMRIMVRIVVRILVRIVVMIVRT